MIIDKDALETLAEASNGYLADHEESVFVGYGSIGYYELELNDDGHRVHISNRLRRRNGFHHGELRNKLTAAGYDPR